MEGEGEKGDLVGVGGHINNGLREASLDTIEVLLLHTINPHACGPTNQPHLAVSRTSTLGTHGAVGSKHCKPWTPGVCVCSRHEKGTGATHPSASSRPCSRTWHTEHRGLCALGGGRLPTSFSVEDQRGYKSAKEQGRKKSGRSSEMRRTRRGPGEEQVWLRTRGGPGEKEELRRTQGRNKPGRMLESTKE